MTRLRPKNNFDSVSTCFTSRYPISSETQRIASFVNDHHGIEKYAKTEVPVMWGLNVIEFPVMMCIMHKRPREPPARFPYICRGKAQTAFKLGRLVGILMLRVKKKRCRSDVKFHTLPASFRGSRHESPREMVCNACKQNKECTHPGAGQGTLA